LALYIHKTWNYRNIGFFPYLLEAGCFGLAAYIGITRITDSRHYDTDVIAGGILGTVIAIIAFRYVLRLFKRAVTIASDERSYNLTA
jgi:membrane-associated phospholipid phosphatase